MKEEIKITTPLDEEKVIQLKAGDLVKISGHIYGARDAAHRRIFELIKKGQKLPIELKGQIIFYAVPPTAAKYIALFFFILSITSSERNPLPIIPLSPLSNKEGV